MGSGHSQRQGPEHRHNPDLLANPLRDAQEAASMLTGTPPRSPAITHHEL
jgi:hypothetical protein